MILTDFLEYCSKYKKSYSSKAEFEKRKVIFDKNLKIIQLKNEN